MLKKIKENLNTKFGRDIFITIIGQIIILFVAFGLNKILSIRLGVTGFGEFSIIKRTAGVLTFVMLAGMGIAIPKYISVYRQLGDKIKEARFVVSGILIIVILSLITIIPLYFFRISFAKMLFKESGYEVYVLPLFFYALSQTITTFATAYYRGLEKFYKYSLFQINVQLLTLFIAFIFSGSVISLLYLWSLVIGSYGLFICVKAWTHYFPIARIKSYKNDLKTTFSELVSFSIPRIPGEFILFSYTVVPLVIINNKMGMEITAFFAVATSINVMINPFFSFIGLVLLPLVSKSLVSNQFSVADQKVNLLAKIYLVFSILGIVFVELFTPQIINILFSSEYQPSVPIVRIIILAILPNAFYLLLRNPLDAASKIPYNTINLLVSFLVLNLIVFLSSTPIAFAGSFVVAYTLLGIMSLLSWRKCRINIYSKTDVLNKK